MHQNGPGAITARKQWIPITMHFLIWVIVFVSPYIFNSEMEGGHHGEFSNHRKFLYLNTVSNFALLALFYFNAAILIPHLVYRRKTGLYVLVIVCCFAVMTLLDYSFFNLFLQHRYFSFYRSITHNFISFALTLAISVAYKTISDKNKADLWHREKQSENLRTELSFLRSQISPHFLFNVLNNIVAMVRIKSEELEPTVLKLSGLMRYMLYENDDEKVVLVSEVEYLQNYIDLQKQRYGPELLLNIDIEIKQDWLTIEPMLLIPFVENAFKHGIGMVHNPEILIRLKAEENYLHFTVKNKYEEQRSVKDKTSGIGLQNVKRRLELLYPGKHILSISNENGWFSIYLHLMLQ